MKEIIDKNTEKLNIENHYWIKEDFISKLGRLAPNLKMINFKGINMSTKSFMDCVCWLQKLQIVEISHCWSLEPAAITVLVQNNPHIHQLKALSCWKAITDESLLQIATYCKKLSIFDIGYCADVTDQGMFHFHE